MLKIHSLLLSASCLALGSCAMFTKSKDNRTVYTLRPIEHAQIASMPTFSAHVTSVSIPGYLDRSEFVARASANELDIRDRDRWGDNLESDLARTLATNLRTLIGSSYIVARDTNLPRRDDAMRIDVEITRFEPLPGGTQIELSGLYAIRDGYSPQPARIHPFAFRVDQQPVTNGSSKTTPQSVEAMNTALDELSIQIAKALITRR